MPQVKIYTMPCAYLKYQQAFSCRVTNAIITFRTFTRSKSNTSL